MKNVLFDDCVDAAIARAGAGWSLLGAPLRRALIAEQITNMAVRFRVLIADDVTLMDRVTEMQKHLNDLYPYGIEAA